MGKSVLLADALHDNGASPLGTDRWVCADPLAHAGRGLMHDFDGWMASGGDVHCTFIVDDAHRVPADVLAQMCRHLDDRAHLVFAGRPVVGCLTISVFLI